MVVATPDILHIGCLTMSWGQWSEQLEKAGRMNGYTVEEVESYKAFIQAAYAHMPVPMDKKRKTKTSRSKNTEKGKIK